MLLSPQSLFSQQTDCIGLTKGGRIALVFSSFWNSRDYFFRKDINLPLQGFIYMFTFSRKFWVISIARL
jgi:hypothetical protein